MPVRKAEFVGLFLEWFGHGSVRFYGKKIAYIDPFSEVFKGDE